MPTAGADDRPIRQNHLQAEHGIPGYAVLDAAQATGVGTDVAADRADLEAGRIRWVEEAFLGDGGLEVRVDDARLDDGEEVSAVYVEDPIHPREGDGQT